MSARLRLWGKWTRASGIRGMEVEKGRRARPHSRRRLRGRLPAGLQGGDGVLDIVVNIQQGIRSDYLNDFIDTVVYVRNLETTVFLLGCLAEVEQDAEAGGIHITEVPEIGDDLDESVLDELGNLVQRGFHVGRVQIAHELDELPMRDAVQVGDLEFYLGVHVLVILPHFRDFHFRARFVDGNVYGVADQLDQRQAASAGIPALSRFLVGFEYVLELIGLVHQSLIAHQELELLAIDAQFDGDFRLGGIPMLNGV